MTTRERIQFTSMSRVNNARAILLLASIYTRNPLEILAQYVENSIDAGAYEVVVEMRSDQILISDNGSGMTPSVLPGDKEILEMHLKDAEGGKPLLEDVRELMSEVSRRSFQWMMECVAFSPKIPQVNVITTGPVRGLLGIGAAAFHQIANQGVWLTKPSLELAQQYWGARIKAEEVPVLRLTAPTTDSLEHLSSSYEVTETTESFTDPYWRAIKSGTIVEITQLKPGLEKIFRPQVLSDHLARRFGQDVLSGRVSITIRGSLTTDPNQARVRELRVQPVVYKGIPAVSKTTAYLNPDTQGDPFELEIYYNPSGRASTGLMLRRLGSDVAKVADLPDFQTYPWNLPLSGYVEFPAVTERRAPWNPDKSMPLPSRVQEEWQQVVWAFAPMIENIVREMEEGTRNQRLRDYAAVAEEATANAIRELPLFQDALPGVLVGRGKGKGGGHRQSRVEDRIIASVTDEHSRGVQGIAIELRQGNKPVETRTTGKSGAISFGRFDPGMYALRVVSLPKEVRLTGSGDQKFRLTKDQPGIRETFRVVTGEQKPEPRRIPTVRVEFTSWDDVGTLYRTDRFEQYGVIEVNIQADDVKEAVQAVIDDGDYEHLDVVTAQVEGMVITMNTLVGELPYLCHEASRLVVKLHHHLRLADEVRKRRSQRQGQGSTAIKKRR